MFQLSLNPEVRNSCVDLCFKTEVLFAGNKSASVYSMKSDETSIGYYLPILDTAKYVYQTTLLVVPWLWLSTVYVSSKLHRFSSLPGYMRLSDATSPFRATPVIC